MTDSELQKEADRLRALYKSAGIAVISFELDRCQFGISAVFDVQKEAPSILRGVADRLEKLEAVEYTGQGHKLE